MAVLQCGLDEISTVMGAGVTHGSISAAVVVTLALVLVIAALVLVPQVLVVLAF